MFKGSENVADGELAGLIENYGGNHNGQTDKDHTLYFEQVPANQLDMVLFLEADRMRSPAITQENVDNQREAVKEERRLRVDNQPYGQDLGNDRRARVRKFRERTFDDRIDGRPRRRVARGLHELLQDLLRAEQRRARDCGRRRCEDRARESAEIFRGHSVRPARRRRSIPPSRRRRKSAGPPSRIRWRG